MEIKLLDQIRSINHRNRDSYMAIRTRVQFLVDAIQTENKDIIQRQVKEALEVLNKDNLFWQELTIEV